MEISKKFLKHLDIRISTLQHEQHAISKRIEGECPDLGMFNGDEKTIHLVGKQMKSKAH